MPIILPLGRTVKAYLRQYGDSRPTLCISCPTCGAEAMQKHGKYCRTAVTNRRVYTVPVYRWRCTGCGKTTSVMPDFLAPYAQFVSVVREGVLRRHLRGLTVREIAARMGSLAVSGLSERTVARWLAQVRKRAPVWAVALSEHLLRLQPGWDLFKQHWEGLAGTLRALCDLGDACRNLGRQANGHPGVYAHCNGLLPDLPRL